nr:MAG TPA: hypothetical protein [Caudoviricetes sp.]
MVSSTIIFHSSFVFRYTTRRQRLSMPFTKSTAQKSRAVTCPAKFFSFFCKLFLTYRILCDIL